MWDRVAAGDAGVWWELGTPNEPLEVAKEVSGSFRWGFPVVGEYLQC
jgi:hypothetical protein